MLETIAILLFVLWLFGFGFHLGGDLIHVLLVIVLGVFILKMLR